MDIVSLDPSDYVVKCDENKSKGRGAKCLKSLAGTDRCSWRDGEWWWWGERAGAVFDKSSGTRLKIKSS